MDRRQAFLAEFFGALGVLEVRYLQVADTFVSGTAVYDPSDPEEHQDFRWFTSSSDAPSPEATQLMGLIRDGGLLHSDKLLVSRQDLWARLNATQNLGYSPEQFAAIIDELLQVRVSMLDDGVESDYYFIHE